MEVLRPLGVQAYKYHKLNSFLTASQGQAHVIKESTQTVLETRMETQDSTHIVVLEHRTAERQVRQVWIPTDPNCRIV